MLFTPPKFDVPTDRESRLEVIRALRADGLVLLPLDQGIQDAALGAVRRICEHPRVCGYSFRLDNFIPDNPKRKRSWSHQDHLEIEATETEFPGFSSSLQKLYYGMLNLGKSIEQGILEQFLKPDTWVTSYENHWSVVWYRSKAYGDTTTHIDCDIAILARPSEPGLKAELSQGESDVNIPPSTCLIIPGRNVEKYTKFQIKAVKHRVISYKPRISHKLEYILGK